MIRIFLIFFVSIPFVCAQEDYKELHYLDKFSFNGIYSFSDEEEHRINLGVSRFIEGFKRYKNGYAMKRVILVFTFDNIKIRWFSSFDVDPNKRSEIIEFEDRERRFLRISKSDPKKEDTGQNYICQILELREGILTRVEPRLNNEVIQTFLKKELNLLVDRFWLQDPSEDGKFKYKQDPLVTVFELVDEIENISKRSFEEYLAR